MENIRLKSKLREVSMAYILWVLFGLHYAYLGKWVLQILYWITFGGLGIWALIDIFRIPDMVDRYNEPIFRKIEEGAIGHDLIKG